MLYLTQRGRTASTMTSATRIGAVGPGQRTVVAGLVVLGRKRARPVVVHGSCSYHSSNDSNTNSIIPNLSRRCTTSSTRPHFLSSSATTRHQRLSTHLAASSPASSSLDAHPARGEEHNNIALPMVMYELVQALTPPPLAGGSSSSWATPRSAELPLVQGMASSPDASSPRGLAGHPTQPSRSLRPPWLSSVRPFAGHEFQQISSNNPQSSSSFWLTYFEDLGCQQQQHSTQSGRADSIDDWIVAADGSPTPTWEMDATQHILPTTRWHDTKDDNDMDRGRNGSKQKYVPRVVEDNPRVRHDPTDTWSAPRHTRHRATKNHQTNHPLQTLETFLRRQQVSEAVQEFKRLIYHQEEMQNEESPVAIPIPVVKALFDLVTRKRGPPFVAYRIVQYGIRQQQQQQALLSKTSSDSGMNHPNHHNVYQDWLEQYKVIVSYVKEMDPTIQYNADIQQLVRNIVMDASRQFDIPSKQILYPILISSLVEQRAVRVGKFAKLLYEELTTSLSDDTQQHEQQSQPVLSDAYLEHLLGQAKFLRSNDLPYPQILATLVERQTRRPYPPHAIAVLEHLFPYSSNLQDTKVTLKALIELQLQHKGASQKETTTAENHDNEGVPSSVAATPESVSSGQRQNGGLQEDSYEYIVDLTTLEAIASAAAQEGDLELCLLVWDALPAMGYHRDTEQPSDAIYESLVLVFCHDPNHYNSAFAVLAEMEDRGYRISRALLRSMSLRLRDRAFNIDVALRELKTLRQNGLHITTAMLNAILSACAERGNIDRALSVLDEYERNNVAFDSDSFAFALEAIGKHLVRRTKQGASPRLIIYCLDTANMLLTTMEEKNVAPNHHVIREYVELLCCADQIETATEVVLEATQTDPNLVNNKTIHRVGMANVQRKEFQLARQLADLATEPQLHLLRTIELQDLAQPFAD